MNTIMKIMWTVAHQRAQTSVEVVYEIIAEDGSLSLRPTGAELYGPAEIVIPDFDNFVQAYYLLRGQDNKT
jgi:hypothetical protein